MMRLTGAGGRAGLAPAMDFTAVRRLLRLSWRAIAERIVAERVPDARLSGLRVIGLHEFSYRKRHRYLTVVVEHEHGHVVWAAQSLRVERRLELRRHPDLRTSRGRRPRYSASPAPSGGVGTWPDYRGRTA